MRPQLATDGYNVALIGEALGQDEAERGEPFVGRAGFTLTRLIEWAGFDRAKFDIFNAVWCRPPSNVLAGTSYEFGSVAHCRDRHWEHLLARSKVLVPLGNTAFSALTGRKGILEKRGYISPGPGQTHIVPTVHPSFITRGQSKYSAAFINDLQKAVGLARTGLRVEPTDYLIDPLPAKALEWALAYRKRLANDPSIRLAYDIETPGKKESDDENKSQDFVQDDRTYFIYRIGFSYEPLTALTIPWTPPYMAAIRVLLEGQGEKVVWNAGFDNPRIRAAGVAINGIVHDGMVAWHILHSDLPKSLGFVATFTCPWQHEWKSMSGSHPGLYNCIDADVELRSMIWIEQELRKAGLWELYDRDVLQLDPILVYMSSKGMPVDRERRLASAIELDKRLKLVMQEMESVTPSEIRTYSPKEGYVKTPESTVGLVPIRLQQDVRRCSKCGQISPTKPHFRTLKKPTAAKPQNPCVGGEVVVVREEVERFARLDPFKASRNMLIRYNQHLNRYLPMKTDPKTKQHKISFDEKAIKLLTGKYPDDKLYPSVLMYRELDKLAGTYIGRPVYEEVVAHSVLLQ